MKYTEYRLAVVRRTAEHLMRLCQPVGNPRRGVVAPAVYSRRGPVGEVVLVPAEQSGYEGVACVDDAARLLVLLLATGSSPERLLGEDRSERTIQGLLSFLLDMQGSDGGFANFILTWDGSQNVNGITSAPNSALWWTGRALRGLCYASSLRISAKAELSFRRAVRIIPMFRRRWDEEASIIWATMEFDMLHQEPSGMNSSDWVEALVGAIRDLPFPDDDKGADVHLWGRVQELVVARAGAASGNDAWISLARDSCHKFLRPLAESGFRGRRSTLPYEVSSVVRNLRAVGSLAHDPELLRASAQGSDWFWGRNAAGRSVIDPSSGRASDGIDGMALNGNSGAEANIEAICATWPRLTSREATVEL